MLFILKPPYVIKTIIAHIRIKYKNDDHFFDCVDMWVKWVAFWLSY